jgi:hypothetical protein
MIRSRGMAWFLGLGSIALAGVTTSSTQGAEGPLLEPTGTWGVGRASVEVVDPSRTMPGSSRPRRLMLRTWYPVARRSAADSVPYVEGLEDARGSLTNDELAVLKAVRTHASTNRQLRARHAPDPSRTATRRMPFSTRIFTRSWPATAIVIAIDHPAVALFVMVDGHVPYSDAGRRPPIRRSIRPCHDTFEIGRTTGCRPAVASQQLNSLRWPAATTSFGADWRLGISGARRDAIVPAAAAPRRPTDGRADRAVATGAGISPIRPFMYL